MPKLNREDNARSRSGRQPTVHKRITQAQLQRLYDAVTAPGKPPSQRKLALHLGVPRSTLQSYMARIDDGSITQDDITAWRSDGPVAGRPAFFSQTELNFLREISDQAVDLRQPLTFPEFCRILADYETRLCDADAGRKRLTPAGTTAWSESTARHVMATARISLRAAEGVSTASAAVTPATLRKWFQNAAAQHKEYAVHSDLIYTSDETKIPISGFSTSVLAPKGAHTVSAVSKPAGMHVTLLTTISTSSHASTEPKPLMVYQHGAVSDSTLKDGINVNHGMPPDWYVACTDKGFLHKILFDRYTQDALIPAVRARRLALGLPADTWACWYLDKCACHLDATILYRCYINNILLVLLPPNTTLYMQPLDVASFGPFKKNLLSEHAQQASSGDVRHFAAAVAKAYTATFTAGARTAAFKCAGLFPLDAEQVVSKLPRPLKVNLKAPLAAPVTPAGPATAPTALPTPDFALPADIKLSSIITALRLKCEGVSDPRTLHEASASFLQLSKELVTRADAIVALKNAQAHAGGTAATFLQSV